MQQQNHESIIEDVRIVLERFWAGTRSIETFLWEAPKSPAQPPLSGGEVAVCDWIREMAFHLSEIDAGLKDFTAAGARDELQEPESDLLFHCFSALGYHLLGLLEEAAVRRTRDICGSPRKGHAEARTSVIGLRRAGEAVRKDLRAVSSLKDVEGDRFVERFAQWLASNIAALAHFVSLAAAYRVSAEGRQATR